VTKEELERLTIQLVANQKQFKQEVNVAHEAHYGSMNREAARLNAQLDAFKSEIKHDVRVLYLCLSSVEFM
jgi:hypothetical protein